MIKIVRTNSKNEDFINLVKKLDAYLKITDGEEHSFYNQFNSIEFLDNVVLAYKNNAAFGCGAFKKFDANNVEIKHMYMSVDHRDQGIATKILVEIEKWAFELGFISCILETGKRQKEAVKFYMKKFYKITENYGQYIGVTNSVCFKKKIENEKG